MPLQIEDLWLRAGFSPNPQQREAILHTTGPLFLTAGPGSGKTRVLLWRTLNLVVFHGVPPDDIFLGTFTEKAALQLKQGLAAYLSEASRHTGKPYDLSRMPTGTVHSICRRILTDRRFSQGRARTEHPVLADELDQYFFLLRNWTELVEEAGFKYHANRVINQYLSGRSSQSRHGAVAAVIGLFNRFSEECLVPKEASRLTRDKTLRQLLRLYGAYRGKQLTDLSLLQQAALEHCRASEGSKQVLRHVIVDEYQDTNHVQESLFFHLAAGHRNLCIVGDDDQALYRFRGSTVENLVEFQSRCERHLGIRPRLINLGTNYRSRRTIVDFYCRFIQQTDWKKGPGKKGAYRIESKKLVAANRDRRPAVVATAPEKPAIVCKEVAALVRRLCDVGKVQDPNQIAFLYPSLKSVQVQRMKEALEKEGLRVYAPRAGRFLEIAEAQDVFGLFLVLFGRPDVDAPGMDEFREWVRQTHRRGKRLAREDRSLAAFLKSRQDQIKSVVRDRRLLLDVVGEKNLQKLATTGHVDQLQMARGVSPRASRYLKGGAILRLVRRRRAVGRPVTVAYVVNRLTSMDWGVLDLFYELMRFRRFRQTFDAAEAGGDEAALWNLALVTQYLGRFQAENSVVLTGGFLDEGRFVRSFFGSFLYGLWRRGESEYEDAEDPFPKGRIPFLTIHQAKGLEFPVVVLGNPKKRSSVQRVEVLVRPLTRRQGEPLDRIPEFDTARLFYVALSRAKNLLVLCRYNGKKAMSESFRALVDDDFPTVAGLDLNGIPVAGPLDQEDLPKAYSYTGDYLAFRSCARRYMIYRRYRFVPARGETMLFGTLVHRTVDDLHQWLRAEAESGRTMP